jgi:hypothetical protein
LTCTGSAFAAALDDEDVVVGLDDDVVPLDPLVCGLVAADLLPPDEQAARTRAPLTTAETASSARRRD